jgi:hypothetical protein
MLMGISQTQSRPCASACLGGRLGQRFSVFCGVLVRESRATSLAGARWGLSPGLYRRPFGGSTVTLIHSQSKDHRSRLTPGEPGWRTHNSHLVQERAEAPLPSAGDKSFGGLSDGDGQQPLPSVRPSQVLTCNGTHSYAPSLRWPHCSCRPKA